MSKYKIGLFGFGCVGQGFVELLHKAKHLNAEVVKVCVKHKEKNRPKTPGTLVYKPEDILEDKTIDLIVELIDDADAALGIVQKALKNSKNVVSANKRMIAENLEALLEWQNNSSGKLLYEGAVCGSIPVLSTLRNYYQHDGVHTLSGIFNGSTNYILTKVIDEKLTYEKALQEAQKSGFAESDPSLDVEGFDPTYKLSILVQQIFNTYINPKDLLRVGIKQITSGDVKFAKENNLRIKLVAHAALVDNKLEAWVAPQFVTTKNPLAGIDFEYNAVKVLSDSFGEQIISGKGAGKLPTGLAVLSDVAAIIQNNANSAQKSRGIIKLDNQKEVEVYLSFETNTSIDWTQFNTINEKYTGRNHCYAIGKIAIEKLKQLTAKYPKASIILTSGEKLENSLNKLTYKSQEAIVAGII